MTEEIYTIGRAADNRVKIDSPDVGRYHARLTVNDAGVFLEDLDSINGTYVNGFRIKEAMLNCRDQITLGKKHVVNPEYLASLFRKINPAVDPNDYKKEFLELKYIYNNYQKDKQKAMLRHQNMINWRRFAVVTIPSVLFIILAHFVWKLDKAYFPIYITLSAALGCLLPFFNTENKRGIYLEREFRKKYRCPKCKLMLSQDWEIHREDKNCPRCNVIWSD